MRSCVTPLTAAAGARIDTIESIGSDRVGKAVEEAWIRNDVAQCGYCQSGQVMSATALLKRTKKPTDAQIDEAMAGNICRCGTYQRLRAAIKDAAASWPDGGLDMILDKYLAQTAPALSRRQFVTMTVGGAVGVALMPAAITRRVGAERQGRASRSEADRGAGGLRQHRTRWHDDGAVQSHGHGPGHRDRAGDDLR